MPEFLRRLFSPEGFMPHGHCYMWRPEIVWLHVVSDALVGLSYTTIPFTLYYFVRRRRDLPYRWMFICFAVFIVACGATHYMEIVTLWTPVYRLSGVVKAITAVASVSTAVLLAWLVPHALAIPSPARLREAIDELKASEHQLRIAKLEAEASNRELEAFSYSVAHDLRAPLRAIEGFSRALHEDCGAALGAVGGEHLQRVRDSAEHMGRLIEDLLGLSRVSRADLARETVDLSGLVQETVTRLRREDASRVVDLVAPPGLTCRGDPQLLAVVVENLLRNAWKFTRDASPARIEFGKAPRAGGGGDGRVEASDVFFVRDNGVGFNPKYAHKLFGAFQRLHSSKEYEGTGIGLATVERIVRRHGGRVWAEGEVGRGATFYFAL